MIWNYENDTYKVSKLNREYTLLNSCAVVGCYDDAIVVYDDWCNFVLFIR